MPKIMGVLVVLVCMFLFCSVNAEEATGPVKPEPIKKVAGDPVIVEEPLFEEGVIEEPAKDSNAYAFIALKVEVLKWKKDFYAQKSVAIQLKYMIQCWNDPEFQEVQRNGRETDKELKRLLILQ